VVIRNIHLAIGPIERIVSFPVADHQVVLVSVPLDSDQNLGSQEPRENHASGHAHSTIPFRAAVHLAVVAFVPLTQDQGLWSQR